MVLFFAFIILTLSSCATFYSRSGKIIRSDFGFSEKDTFLLLPVKINAYDFMDIDEASYIINEKLYYELKRRVKPEIFGPGRDKNLTPEYTIVPELIVKSYADNYLEKHLFILRVLIKKKGEVICYFRSEYNGCKSLFDRGVLNNLIDGFVGKFKKLVE